MMRSKTKFLESLAREFLEKSIGNLDFIADEDDVDLVGPRVIIAEEPNKNGDSLLESPLKETEK